MNSTLSKLNHVVVVGGGFAGLRAVRQVLRSSQTRVTLIDQKNHHLFQPLLYQVAMAALSPTEIAVPIRSIFRKEARCQVLMDEVLSVDLIGKKIKTREREVSQVRERAAADLEHEISYDALILACGANHSYFGKNHWENFAPGLKTLEQATEIRRRVLEAFEHAERETDPHRQREYLTFVVVGGGPTGVELAGALGEISRYTLSRDFRHIDPRQTRVVLVEAGPRILPSFAEKLSSRAMRDLESLGVTVWSSTRVTDINEEGVQFGEEFLRARTILWAAGVEAPALNRVMHQDHAIELDRAGRICLNADLSIPGFSNVFVAGDQGCLIGPEGRPLPGIAPVAIQQGNCAGENVLAMLAGQATRPFKYFDKGQMATVGRKKAILQFGRGGWFKMTGTSAWYAWLFVHIFYLIEFRSRVKVFLEWAWSYLFYKRGARIIEAKEWRQYTKCPGLCGMRRSWEANRES